MSRRKITASTPKGSGFSVADEIEKRLRAVGRAPARKKIPRSTMNRLLSAEAFRNRLGVSVVKGKLELTHDEQVVLAALERVADDLSSKRIVLGDIWDVDGKRGYLDRLENEGILPTAKDAIIKGKPGKVRLSPVRPSPIPAPRPQRRTTLIPQVSYPIAWVGRLQRHRAIWEELQFKLDLSEHPNGISVLLRVLLELSVENYIAQTSLAVNDGDKLAARMLKVGRQLHAMKKIDQKQLGVITSSNNSINLFRLILLIATCIHRTLPRRLSTLLLCGIAWQNLSSCACRHSSQLSTKRRFYTELANSVQIGASALS